MAKKGMGLDPEQSPHHNGRTHLLVIAIDAYQHCPPLYNCVKDANDLIAVLTEKYGLAPDNITTLFNEEATRDHIYRAFEKMVTTVRSPDNLLIFFSGHGEYNRNFRQGYWIPVEAEAGRPSQYIPNSEVRIFLSAIAAHHIFLMADSCFSGSLFTQGADRYVSKRYEADPSRWGLTSGRNEIVSDGKPGDNSPFAESLLYRLRKNQDTIGVQELCAHVVEYVQSNAEQSPIGEPLRVAGHKNGQFVFRSLPAAAAAEVITEVKPDGVDRTNPPVPPVIKPINQTSNPGPSQTGTRPKPASWYQRKRLRALGGGILLILAFLLGKQLIQWANGRNPELRNWERTETIGTSGAYRSFIENYPNSSRRQLAEKRLQDITGTSAGELPTINSPTIPVVSLGGARGRAQLQNIAADPDLQVRCNNSDCDCKVTGAVMIRLRSGQPAAAVRLTGSGLSAEAKRLIREGKPRDIYFFENIKINCSGELNERSADGFAVEVSSLQPLPTDAKSPYVRAFLPELSSRQVSAAEFKALLGMSAKRTDCNSDCNCGVEYFTLSRAPQGGKVVTVNNKGALYNAETLKLIRSAGSGDQYFFSGIYAKCGSESTALVNSLVFTIK